MTYPGTSTSPGSTTFPGGPNPNFPTVNFQIEFVAGTWTTIPNVSTVSAGRGRSYELAAPQAGSMTLAIDCSDGSLDPGNTSSPNYPNVKINKQARVQVTWNGVTKTIFTGRIERYPQRWVYAGNYQWTDMVVVDPLARLNKVILGPIAYSTIASHNPVFWWPLDDGVGSTKAGSRVGGAPLYQLTSNAAGSTAGPFQTFGSVPAFRTLGYGMDGMPTATFAPGANSLTVSPADMTVLRSPDNTPILPATGPWTVYCSWSSTAPNLKGVAGNGTRVLVLNAADGSSYIAMGVDGNDVCDYFIADAGSGGSANPATYSTGFYPAGVYYSQGPWNNGLGHYCAVSLSSDHMSVNVIFSNSGYVQALTKNDGTAWDFSTITSFSVGGEYRPNRNGNFAFNAWTGDVNNVAVFDTDLFTNNATAISDIVASEMFGFTGDDTVKRFGRLSQLAGRAIPTAGSTVGNSSVQHANLHGKSLTSALTELVDDEQGVLFIDGDGTVNFVNRHYRYNPAPTITLTDQGADGAGVYRYTGLTTDFDDQYLLNDVTVQQTLGVTARSTDAQSITDNGTYSTSITTLVNNAQQAIDRAAYTVGRYREPLQRIASLKLEPSADVNLWPLVTSLELNQAVTVVRTPKQGVSFSQVYWVEKIDYSINAAGPSFGLTLQLSPADVNSYLVLDDPVRGKLDSGNELAY